MKHTPGPWRALKQTGNSEIFIVADDESGRVEVATVHRESEYAVLPVAENASLIAAAPELLAACKFGANLITSGKRFGADELNILLGLMVAAAAKAEGVQAELKHDVLKPVTMREVVTSVMTALAKHEVKK